jgi:hypothetical protein
LWVLEKVESSNRLLDERLKAYFISRSKNSYRREVSLLPYIAYADDCYWNLKYPTDQCLGGYNELFLFLQCNWSKSTKERSSRVIGKKHYETLCFLEMYFPSAFFYISIHFTIHLIKEIKLLGHVFLHQMYAYERFNNILKLFVRN